MRFPLVRFGRDMRPTEPWEERLAPLILPVVFPLWFAAVSLAVAVVWLALLTWAVVSLAWAAVSPVLPRAWRFPWDVWDAGYDLDPSLHDTCPACQARLTLGPVHRRGRTTRSGFGGVFTSPGQAAHCPGCQRVFHRSALGMLWSPWQETDAERGAAPGPAAR